MASLKNISKANQRVHRERSQPLAREHLGFLEKKKDYKLRANDYNQKQKKLRNLSKKALDKNPDEFYMHMVNSRTTDGVHTEKEKELHTVEQEKLLRANNLTYINFKLNYEKKKIEKLQSSLHFVEGTSSRPNKHIFFVDNLNEARQFDPAKRLETNRKFLNGYAIQPNMSKLTAHSSSNIAVDKEQVKKATKARMESYRELEKRLLRRKELEVVAQKLQVQKHLAKTEKSVKPKKIRRARKDKAAIYVWPLQRQK